MNDYDKLSREDLERGVDQANHCSRKIIELFQNYPLENSDQAVVFATTVILNILMSEVYRAQPRPGKFRDDYRNAILRKLKGLAKRLDGKEMTPEEDAEEAAAYRRSMQ